MTQADQEIPLCRDCVFLRRDLLFFWSHQFSRCAAPQTRNPVDGKPRYYCDTERRFEADSCGKSGRWFVAKAESK